MAVFLKKGEKKRNPLLNSPKISTSQPMTDKFWSRVKVLCAGIKSICKLYGHGSCRAVSSGLCLLLDEHSGSCSCSQAELGGIFMAQQFQTGQQLSGGDHNEK